MIRKEPDELEQKLHDLQIKECGLEKLEPAGWNGDEPTFAWMCLRPFRDVQEWDSQLTEWRRRRAKNFGFGLNHPSTALPTKS